MLSVTCVSAADNQTDDVVLESDSVTEEVLADSVGDFTELNTNITNTDNVLKLEKNYAFNPDTDTGFKEGIVINKNNYVIDGDGHAISGANQARIFNIKASNVTLKNINFINGTSDNGQTYKHGGAVFFQQSGFVENCNFSYNSVPNSGAYGGAIYFDSVGTVKGSNFINNSGRYGGGIYFSGRGNVTECNFTGNRANYGGGIYFDSLGNVMGCDFTNNSAQDSAGAIDFANSGSVLNSNFTYNKAITAQGGAIHTTHDLKVEGSYFAFNTALESVGGAICFYGYSSQGRFAKNNIFMYNSANTGGAIYFVFGGYSTDNKFINNTASADGGAISGLGMINSTRDKFINNTAGKGGAIYFMESGTATDCNFINNTAANTGGAIYFMESGTVTDCNFINNTLTGTQGQISGGAIYFAKVGEVTGSNFTNNFASYAGGAIYFTQNGKVTDCKFFNNKGNDGGAIYFYENGNVTCCEFNNNYAGSGGAVMFHKEGTVLNSNFTYNKASSGAGGAIRSWVALKVEDSYFAFNTAEKGVGGAINFDGVDSQDRIAKNCTFIGNSAASGGAIYFWIAGESIDNKFINNTASRLGGAMYLYGKIESTGDQFINNTAVSGGALYIGYNTVANLTRDTFEDNTAADGTNYIFLYGTSQVITTDTTPADLKPYKSVEMEVINITGIVTYAETVNITVNVTSNKKVLENGTVFITINDANYTADVENGTATIRIPKVDVGKYDANVTYVGDSIYTKPSKPVSFEVTYLIVSLAVNATKIIVYGDIFKAVVNVTAKGVPINEGNVIFASAMGNVIANVTDGIALIEIPNLDAGSYSGYLVFYGGDNYCCDPELCSFKVNPAVVNITVDSTDIVYGGALKVNVISDIPVNQGIVTIGLNGKNYTANVVNGIASVVMSGLNVGSYSADVKFSGATNYQNASKLVSFNVAKMNTAISASNKAYVINYGGEYSATLKDANGNPIVGQKVTFTLNGKNIGSAATNAKGVATIKLTAAILKAAKAGRKNLVIGFDSTNYNAAAKTVKITINKEKTKIVAKKKTFKKAQKVKKYVVTLKNSKNKAVKKVKVSLKINKKTYTAKTNKNGKAIFKIKKLTKKGTFKATIKFKANAYYKVATKKVKIKIK